MTDLTPDERRQVVEALEREATRLRNVVSGYRAAKDRTRNPDVRAMAEEGAAGMDERIKRLTALVTRLRGDSGGASSGAGGRGV